MPDMKRETAQVSGDLLRSIADAGGEAAEVSDGVATLVMALHMVLSMGLPPPAVLFEQIEQEVRKLIAVLPEEFMDRVHLLENMGEIMIEAKAHYHGNQDR